MNFPYKVITHKRWGEGEVKGLRGWLYTNTGEPYQAWCTDYEEGGFVSIKFKNKEDAIFFSLVWETK